MTIDRLFINVGTEITKVVPGLVSTEVDSKYVECTARPPMLCPARLGAVPVRPSHLA